MEESRHLFSQRVLLAPTNQAVLCINAYLPALGHTGRPAGRRFISGGNMSHKPGYAALIASEILESVKRISNSPIQAAAG